MKKDVMFISLVVSMLILSGCSGPTGRAISDIPDHEPRESISEKIIEAEPDFQPQPKVEITDGLITTFQSVENDICAEDGKPIIRLYSTTRCPHCLWVKDTFDSVAKEYVDQGLIVAHHWELDNQDDTLTEEIESEIPEADLITLAQFNQQGYVPAYVFGCRYARIGNGHEREMSLDAEANEFRAVIEKLIRESE